MRTRGLLIKDDMINAILRGDKTQMRERVTEIAYPESEIKYIDGQLMGKHRKKGWLPVIECCKIQPDDLIWVREPWSLPADEEIAKGVSPTTILYRANGPNQPIRQKRWKPPVFMPRNFARVYLYVENVRVQHLQNITDDECDKDGVEQSYKQYLERCGNTQEPLSKREYWGYYLWDKTLSQRLRIPVLDDVYYDNCWNANPWVWVIEFKLCNILGELIPTPTTIY